MHPPPEDWTAAAAKGTQRVKIRFDRFELDTDEKSVTGPDGPIALRPQTFAVLVCLLERAPAVVSRDQLLDDVWGHQATSFSSVAQTIKELRQALGDSSSDPRLIATRRRLGYQFIADCAVVPDAASRPTPAPAPLPPSTEPEVAPRSVLPRAWPALLALLIVGGLWLLLVGQRAVDAPADAEQPPVIALRGMVNASDDASLDWLAPALETYLGHALVELGGFRVLTVDPQGDGANAALDGVDFVVEGRYLSAGIDGARLVAQLRRPGSGEILGSLERGHGDWDVAELTIGMADAIRQRLGFDRPPAADAAGLRTRLPRAVAAQRGYFDALAALAALQPDEALRRIAQARTEAPDSPRLEHLASLAHAERGDLEAARASSQRVLAATRLWPRRDRLDLEAIAATLGFDHDLAADRLQALNEFFPEPEVSRRLVGAQIAAGRLAAAREALDSLRLNLPDDPRVALLDAELAEAAGDHAQQLEAALRAMPLAEASAPGLVVEARLAAVRALIGLGDMETAAERLAAVDDTSGNLLQQARAVLLAARIDFLQGRLEPALASAETALEAFDAIPAPIDAAEARLTLSDVLERSGRLAEATEAAQAAIAEFQRLADLRRKARAQVRISTLLARQQRLEPAIEGLVEAASHFRQFGDRQGEAAALLNHGLLLARSGRLIDAEPLFQRALDAFRDASDLRGEALALGNLAAIAGDRRDMRRSIELAEESLTLFELLGAQTDIARVSYNLGLIHRREGDLLSAELRVRQAADAFAAQGAVLMQTRALTTLGAILVGAGRLEDVDAVLTEIDGLAIEDAAELAVVHNVRGERALQLGRVTEARAEFDAGRELMASIGADNHLLVSRLNLARVALAEGALVQAEQEGRELARRFTEIRVPHRETDSLLLVAAALVEQGRDEEARTVLADIEARLDAAPDAEQRLRAALLRGRVSDAELARQHLAWVETTAGQQGFLPLMAAAQALGRAADGQ
nr:winged helix-turn-helix domain-containing protein [Wenzhouxiangella sp. XN79A]